MICVDASSAAKWLFEEEHYQKARALHRAAISASERVVAPPLLPIEVTNIIRQQIRRAKPPHQRALSVAEATESLERFLTLSVELITPPELHQQARALAITYDLPAVYDAHYVALAQQLGCSLWTADRRLVRAVGEKLPFVRWIGDYRQP